MSKKDDLGDLDLDKKMKEARHKAFDDDLKKLYENHGMKMVAALYCDPVTGIVEPRILKMPSDE